MEESGEATVKEENPLPMLAFIYCDALVNTEQRTDKTPIPRETVRLAYKEEHNMILDMLKRSGRKIRFHSEPATQISIRNRLSSGCKILHFTGHGCAHSLEFENEERCGEAKSLEGDYLAGLPVFRDAGNLPKLVFLSACGSEECGRALANAGVPHLVAIKSGAEVPEKAAQDFCVPFYEALFTGKYTLQQAFDIATCTVRANSPKAAETFILIPTNGGHSGTQLFRFFLVARKRSLHFSMMSSFIPYSRNTVFSQGGSLQLADVALGATIQEKIISRKTIPTNC